MFTGIIENLGRVVANRPTAAGRRIEVETMGWGSVPQAGDSISVRGVCLTVVEAGREGQTLRLAFDAVPETLAKTTLGALSPGDTVHLEHAATLATLLGGHLVQGHVDGVGRVVGVSKAPEYRLTIDPGAPLLPYLAPKGSVCVDGVSLTIASLDRAAGTFDVALIPVTLDKTALGRLGAGSRVNIECDVIAKTIVHYLREFVSNGAPG
jgi:riboflavin synthase